MMVEAGSAPGGPHPFTSTGRRPMRATGRSTPITRREFLGVGAAAAAAAACDLRSMEDERAGAPPNGRLSARPGTPTGSASPGLAPLGLSPDRDGLLYVPSGYAAASPAPLVLMLHGAGGSAHGAIRPFRELADEAGLVLLVPESRGVTWDAIRGDYAADAEFIDRALVDVFRKVAVDPRRLTIEGFSDGATYALGLGLTNGDLFRRIVAFSPGFLPPAVPHGRPAIFISHGTRDAVLPIEQCSRRIVPQLERMRYDVEYREFDGPHTVPPPIARDALAWMRT